jgi:hypothetical protein
MEGALAFGASASMSLSLAWIKRSLDAKDFWTGLKLNPLQAVVSTYIADFACYWHDYEIHDLRRNVSQHNCLLVGYHSRCTVDNLYLWCHINANFLISHVFFSIPGVRELVKSLGAIPSKGMVSATSDEVFSELLLNADRPMLLLPGGAYEAMKPWDRKYMVDWKKEPGFARVIGSSEQLRSVVKVVPFFTKNSEDIFYTTKWWFNFTGNFVHTGMADASKGTLWKLPFVLTLGIYSFGLSFLPKPVKLDTYFAEPVTFLKDESVEQFSERVRFSLQELIVRVNAIPQRHLRNSSLWGYPYAIYKGSSIALQLSLFHWANIMFFFSALPVGLLFVSVTGSGRTERRI